MKQFCKVAFFSEANHIGPVPRNHPNMRTDLAWQAALEADHYPSQSYKLSAVTQTIPDKYYDIGIIILSKTNPNFNITPIRRICSRVSVMQEGPRWYWQDWPIQMQFEYIKLIRSVDHLYCHNERDVRYYQGIVGHDRVYVLQSLMITDAIDVDSLTTPAHRTGIMVGGNFVSWYGGADSFIVASYTDNAVYMPTMGRRADGEDNVDGITHVPYILWRDWITELSRRKIGIHLMRTHAAGTFALNCAYLGIPCIGYNHLDTQMKLHPICSISDGDIKTAIEIAEKLSNDEDFYNICAMKARLRYEEYYSETVFLNKFKESL